MTGLSDAFKDEMSRGAIVDLTNDDFATITVPPRAGLWTLHSLALIWGRGKRAGHFHLSLQLIFWGGLALANLVLMWIGIVNLFVTLIVMAALVLGWYGHGRVAKITCLRAAGYTYDWKTHTAHRIVRTADLKE